MIRTLLAARPLPLIIQNLCEASKPADIPSHIFGNHTLVSYSKLMRIGYARVSTTGQSLDQQREKLGADGCEKIFEEQVSGAKKDRPELALALDFAREGDVIVVTKLDRLARSSFHLAQIAEGLQTKKVDLVVLDQSGIDTTKPTGKLLYTMLGAIAQFERGLIVERTTEGRRTARDKGVQFGPKRKLTKGQLTELRREFKDGVNRTELAERYKISVGSVYRLCSTP